MWVKDENAWAEFALRQFLGQWDADSKFGNSFTEESKKAIMDISKKYYRKAMTPVVSDAIKK